MTRFNERRFQVWRMDDQGIHIALFAKPERGAGANCDILNRIVGQRCKFIKKDVKQPGISHGRGGGQAKICRCSVSFSRKTS